MRAVTFAEKLDYCPDYPDPSPGPQECLVKVHLAGVCATDIHITKGYMQYAGVLGHEMVGTVESGSPDFQGKRVVAEINCVCRSCDMCQAGLASHCRNRTVMGIAGRDGCFADYIAIPERNLHVVPDSITDEEAVFIEPLAAAWQVIRQVPIDKRMKVAVVGSGRLGLLVAQVINTTGCKMELIGRNRHSLMMGEKKHIQTCHVDDLVPRADRDLVVDCSGSPEGLQLSLSLVRPRGTIVLKSTYAGALPLDLAPAVVNEVSIVGSRCGPFPEAIDCLARKQVDVLSMVSKSFDIDRGIEAIQAAVDRDNIKVLIKINPR